MCRQLEIAESTRHLWRNQYDGMRAYEAQKLEELAEGNL